MKKVIVGVVSVLASALLMAGCNKQVIDLTYEYSWAQLKMPDGTITRATSCKRRLTA
jgi:major membrane immunogen (membrane-anchored lipoprotein)